MEQCLGIGNGSSQPIRSSFIQYLDTIQSLEGQGVQVKVSDISDAMELPRPGVTRTVKEMEEKEEHQQHNTDKTWNCCVFR